MRLAAAEARLRASEVAAETTLGVLLRAAERRGERPFLHDFDTGTRSWRAVGWREFADLVLAAAGVLEAAGVNRGDTVALVSENRLGWVVADLAIQACGAASVAVHSGLAPATVSHLVENARPRLAIVSSTAAADGLGDLPRLPVEEVGERPSGRTLSRERMLALGGDDIATIAYTSGTTGQPKGAEIRHRAIAAMLEASDVTLPIREDDVILSVLPPTHILERFAGLYFGGLREGAQLYIGRGLSHIADDIAEVRPTCMIAVPRLLEKVMQGVVAEVRRGPLPQRLAFTAAIRLGARNPVTDRLVLRRVRDRVSGGRLRIFISGGAPLALPVERFFWSLGLPVYQGWGMTELTCVATVNTPTLHRFGTVGRPLPSVQVRTADDGELLVRSPGVMTGYHRDPEATRETLVDGWLHTGDVGVVDAEGVVTVTDRKKDLLKTSGGKYVAPQPIETALQQDPLLDGAMVIGDGRPFAAALLFPNWAEVGRRLGVSGRPETLARHGRVVSHFRERIAALNAGLAHHETIKQFRLLAGPLAEDERTVTYKLRRRIVSERYADVIEEMYASAARGPRGRPARR